MKLLVVCDAIKKFVGKNEYIDELVAKRIDNFQTRNRKEGVYTIFLNRVVDKMSEELGTLNPAVLGDESTIPPKVFKLISNPNSSVCFRKSVDPFDKSDPDLSMIVENVCTQLQSRYDSKFTSVSLLYASNETQLNKAVEKAFKEQPAFSDLPFKTVRL